MKKVGIIGTGTMGLGIAHVFAKSGYNVYIKSMRGNSQLAKEKIVKNIEKLKSKNKITEEEASFIISNINPVKYDEQLVDCNLILEAIGENVEEKKDLFRFLDILCEEKTIFATNTSSLSITELASVTSRADKFIGMHFFNPATLMKLVEIIRGLQTSQETYEYINDIVIDIQKDPVEINEAPGFVVNRMLIPMINEAICILSEGVASVEDIDKAMTLGANHPMGPLALGDLIGLDICLNIMDVLYKETGDSKYRANSLLRKYVRVGWLGRKTKKGFYEY